MKKTIMSHKPNVDIRLLYLKHKTKKKENRKRVAVTQSVLKSLNPVEPAHSDSPSFASTTRPGLLPRVPEKNLKNKFQSVRKT